jgi:hypothetical protein
VPDVLVPLDATAGGHRGRLGTPEQCVILDIPQGPNLNLLGLIVTIGPIRSVADRAGLLGGILASLMRRNRVLPRPAGDALREKPENRPRNGI